MAAYPWGAMKNELRELLDRLREARERATAVDPHDSQHFVYITNEISIQDGGWQADWPLPTVDQLRQLNERGLLRMEPFTRGGGFKISLTEPGIDDEEFDLDIAKYLAANLPPSVQQNFNAPVQNVAGRDVIHQGMSVDEFVAALEMAVDAVTEPGPERDEARSTVRKLLSTSGKIAKVTMDAAITGIIQRAIAHLFDA